MTSAMVVEWNGIERRNQYHSVGLPFAGRLGRRADDERHTVEAASRGDSAAFESLVQLHQMAIYGYFRPRLVEPADADDLCQEVLLRAYRNLATFNYTVSLRAWLLGIARNVFREYARSTRRRREVTWTAVCLDVEQAMLEECGRFDDVLPLLPDCIESLSTGARTALHLYYGGSYSLTEVADRMGRSSDGVRLLLYRARKALKRSLEMKLARASD